MTWTSEEERRENPPDKPYCNRYPTVSQRSWPMFDKYLRDRNLDYALARANSWFPSRTVDGYTRVVVPGTSDQTGNLYWQARLIQTDTIGSEASPRRWESPHGVSRGNSVCIVWPDTGSRTRVPRSVVVEGPMDALAAAGAGCIGLALMGVNAGAEVLSLTSRLLRGTIPLMIMDLNAEEAMAINQAKLADLGLKCKLVSPYPGKDFAALDRVARKELLKRA